MNELNRFEDLRLKVIEWASKKGIFEKGTPIAQAGKTLEEATEIKEAIEWYELKGISDEEREEAKSEIVDGIGDTIVTLIIQAEMQGINPLDCLETAYNVIAKRKGKMIDGQFVKE